MVCTGRSWTELALPVHVGNKASGRGTFLACFAPVVLLLVVLAVEIWWFNSLSGNLISSWQSHQAEASAIVSRYPNSFTPAEVNSSRYGLLTVAIAAKASSILQNIVVQLEISSVALLALGILFSVNNARILPRKYNEAGGNEKQTYWLDSGTSISQSISAAVTVVVALVGSVSLLSPSIVGGYVMAGLQILLLCVVFGVLVRAVSSEMVIKPATGTEKMTVDSATAAEWEGLTSIQFLLLAVGTALLILQVATF